MLDDGAELAILLFAKADIAGIDAIFVERLRAGRVLSQQFVADIMKIAHQRRGDAHFQQPLLDVRHGGGGLIAVDRDAHDFRARARQIGDLPHRGLDVGGVGIGHGLHDDGRATPHHYAACGLSYPHADGAAARGGGGLNGAGVVGQ